MVHVLPQTTIQQCDDCQDCAIRPMLNGGPRPLPTKRVGTGVPEVLFVGHALNKTAQEPLGGLTCNPLHDAIKVFEVGTHLRTNVFRCRIGYQWDHVPPDALPGKVCIEALKSDLSLKPLLVAALGSPPTLVLTEKNGSELGLEIREVDWQGLRFPLISLPGQFSLDYEQSYRNFWEKQWNFIKEYLEKRRRD